MKLQDLENLTIENFDNHPELKRRLIVYCIATYQEDAIIDDYHLLMEFNYLKLNKKLYELERPINLDKSS